MKSNFFSVKKITFYKKKKKKKKKNWKKCMGIS